MREYRKNVMFEMLYAALERNTIHQRLLFEQRQLERPLTPEEIDKIWDSERKEIGFAATDLESDVIELYGADGLK